MVNTRQRLGVVFLCTNAQCGNLEFGETSNLAWRGEVVPRRWTKTSESIMYVAAVARVMEFMSSAGHFMVSRFHRDFDFLPNYVFDGG